MPSAAVPLLRPPVKLVVGLLAAIPFSRIASVLFRGRVYGTHASHASASSPVEPHFRIYE